MDPTRTIDTCPLLIRALTHCLHAKSIFHSIVKSYSLLFSTLLAAKVAAAPDEHRGGPVSNIILETKVWKKLWGPVAVQAQGAVPATHFVPWSAIATARGNDAGVANTILNGILKDKEEPLSHEDRLEVKNGGGDQWYQPSECWAQYGVIEKP